MKVYELFKTDFELDLADVKRNGIEDTVESEIESIIKANEIEHIDRSSTLIEPLMRKFNNLDCEPLEYDEKYGLALGEVYVIAEMEYNQFDEYTIGDIYTFKCSQ